MSIFFLFLLAGFQQAAPAAGPVLGPKELTLTVKLLSPISTRTNKQDDRFTALIEQPSEFQQGVLEGKITKLSKPKKGVKKGKAEIAFQFETITFNGKTSPITAGLKDVVNSKGIKGVDEEGQVIGTSSNKKRVGATLAGAGIGSLIGALGGGAQGAATGAAVGAGVGLMIGLTMTTSGSELEFLPGSVFTVEASDRAANAK